MEAAATESGSLPWNVWPAGSRAPSTPLDTLPGSRGAPGPGAAGRSAPSAAGAPGGCELICSPSFASAPDQRHAPTGLQSTTARSSERKTGQILARCVTEQPGDLAAGGLALLSRRLGLDFRAGPAAFALALRYRHISSYRCPATSARQRRNLESGLPEPRAGGNDAAATRTWNAPGGIRQHASLDSGQGTGQRCPQGGICRRPADSGGMRATGG